jgi:two-component system, NtrC family, response regulator HydG
MMPRVLAVDDEEGLRLIIADILDMEGYEVVCCDNVDAAKEKLSSEAFDLALVDVFLTSEPVGLNLVNHILVEYPKIGVIIMTGFADKAQVAKACVSGAYTCIDKPFDLDDLLRVIGTVLDEKSADSSGGTL